MLNFETSFLWHRPIDTTFKFADGRLEIERGKLSEKQTRTLTSGPDDCKIDLYDPLNEAKAPYRLFALIKGSEESTISFANTYGMVWQRTTDRTTNKTRKCLAFDMDLDLTYMEQTSYKLTNGVDLWDSIRPRINDNILDTKLS